VSPTTLPPRSGRQSYIYICAYGGIKYSYVTGAYIRPSRKLNYPPATQRQKLRRARVVPQSSVTTSLLNVPVDTTTTSGALLQTGDYWVVKRPIALLLGPFPTQKEPGEAMPFWTHLRAGGREKA
jgi:hypothetical protein